MTVPFVIDTTCATNGARKSAPTIPPASWRTFSEALGTLAARAGQSPALDEPSAADLKALAARMKRNEVVVAFGGHFSAGKSSMLNLALGRPLLPVDDLPETGACCALRSGDRDEVVVTSRDGTRRAIPCTTEAIRAEVALLTATGRSNGRLEDVDSLEIRLAGAPIPRGACWVDSPGTNSGAESQRAHRVAGRADVLVWVLKSEQFLSESDAAELAGHVRRHGPTSVVLLINAVLSQPTAEAWDWFHAERIPAYRQRIVDRLGLMGFPDGYAPPTLSTSAEAAATFPGQFGGAELHALLTAIDGPDAPIVRRSRLGRAAVELARLADDLAPRLEQVAAENRRRRDRYEARRVEIERGRTRFGPAVEQAVDTFLSRFAREAKDRAQAIAEPITSGSLQRDDTYTRTLNETLRAAAREALESLHAALAKAADNARQSRPPAAVTDRIQTLLIPLKVTVEVADNAMGAGGVAGGAAAGALIGSVVPIIGTGIGALVGALIGGGASASEAMEKDVRETKANVRTAANAAIDELKGYRDQVRALVLEKCQPLTLLNDLEAPDQGLEEELRETLGRLRDLASAAARLAGIEVGR